MYIIIDFILDIIDKVPNNIRGIPKLKSLFLKLVKKDRYKFSPISKNFKIGINLNDTSENHIWLGIKPTYIHQFLKSNLQPDSVFIDCGANIGIWSLIAHETIQETGKVYSFEPNPTLYKRLTTNLEFNNVGNNWICHPMGCHLNLIQHF